MNLKRLKDDELLSHTKQLAKEEREVLTKILHHLQEVERRKLFCDLGYQSLFAYAVKELRYSEGQAGRRIQAMRLIKELSSVEKKKLESKISTGSISLSDISQAQSFFRSSQKSTPGKKINTLEKLEILKTLENKTTREAEKILLQIAPEQALPKERERVISENHTKVRFVMNNDLKKQLEVLRSLLGPKSVDMSFAELVSSMTKISIEALQIKKFGKKRVLKNEEMVKSSGGNFPKKNIRAPAAELLRVKTQLKTSRETSLDEPKNALKAKAQKTGPRNIFKNASSNIPSSVRRGIPRSTQHQVWLRDQKSCTNCGGQRNLNIDHIRPVALAGNSKLENLRLLCFHCNQRQAMKAFGIGYIKVCQNKIKQTKLVK